MSNLLEGVLKVTFAGMEEREIAGEILIQTGKPCRSGVWPQQVTVRDLGAAVARAICTQYDPNEALQEFLLGYHAMVARGYQWENPNLLPHGNEDESVS